MTRSIINLTTLSALLIATLTPPVDACGTRSRRSTYYSAPRTVRVVRPVTVVHPAVVARPAVVPVAVPPPRELPTVPAGSQLTIPANFLGAQPGSVFMVFDNIKLPVQVDRWEMTGVTITLPPMAIKDAVVIRVDIVLPHGKLGHSQELRVTAPSPVVLHPVGPTSPLPTEAALGVSQRPLGVSPQVANVATGSPIVLPTASTARPAAPAVPPSSGQQPMVLPTASPAASGSPGGAPQLQGNGTPAQPFVLPAAQSVNTAPSVVAAPPTTEPQIAEGDDSWLDDNPILQEGLQSDPAVEAAGNEMVAPAQVEAIEPAPPAAPITANGVTTALSVLAQVLLSK